MKNKSLIDEQYSKGGDSICLQESITIQNNEGKKAIIEFGGDKVVYSGDLKQDESAKIFWDCFAYLFENAVKKEAKKLITEYEEE
jgi:hypothetical protein